MRASLSYHHQKITSMFIVISFAIFTLCCLIIKPSSPVNSLLYPVRIASFITFIVSFGIYSYLRAITLFGDYIKCSMLRSVIANIVLFVNLFTCVAVLVAILYIHFYSMISFTN